MAVKLSSAVDQAVDRPTPKTPLVAMVGNPNVGKTSVFNRLTNLLAKTSNFAGTTIERRFGTADLGQSRLCTVVDLPGLYSLEPTSPEEEVARDFLLGTPPKNGALTQSPDAIVIVVDATNLQRTLVIAREALRLGRPTIVAVNLMDAARRRGIEIDTQSLSIKLDCPVVAISARTGEGFAELRDAMRQGLVPRLPQLVGDKDDCGSCGACPYADAHRWATTLARESTRSGWTVSDQTTDRIDAVLTHAWIGPIVFAIIMMSTFASVFWIAQSPMDWLEAIFASISGTVGAILPDGDLRSLLTDGVIGGVGGVMVFLPQICILFFALAILEDSGYLARAVIVIDRWMRLAGLPGQAFVPLLAAHACAIPAIMSTRVISNRRDRFAAIMVIPLMTCSARLPVYTLIAAMLFANRPWMAAALFASAYAVGMIAAFVVAWVLQRTVLPGRASPLIMDLPPYRMPSFSSAFRHAYERGWMFLRDAGTTILMISIAIWVLSTYPKMPESRFAETLAGSGMSADSMSESEYENQFAQASQEYSIIGRMGKAVAPVFAPLGFDWKTSVGVMTSFAAREVVVSTLSILYGLGPEPEDETSLTDRLSAARRDDGSPVFTNATCVSLLVFFVLAMQCLPTQAVTRRETGSWGWAVFQFSYMTVLAYVAAAVAYQAVRMLG